ncbi:MAG: hypothetical protein CVU65_12360 [Deltaproteobacteria bacterium HGW-Deltaproteobacteria-22]|jgi:hypothetical protein|nr:MAG: hypothetical protein CVU65_12360 [Deltaproteobacteria bacterium HGW-Deltaproteobacteria-22]
MIRLSFLLILLLSWPALGQNVLLPDPAGTPTMPPTVSLSPLPPGVAVSPAPLRQVDPAQVVAVDPVAGVPARSGDEPVVLIDLADAPKEIYIGQSFFVEITVTSRPGVQINLPSKIDPGPRFTLEGEPSEVATVTFDSGNLMRKYRLKLVSWTTDRLLDRRMERVRARLQRHEQDLNEQKTKQTEARLANQDTKAIDELIAKYQIRVDADLQELHAIESEYEVRPVPITYRRNDGSMGVVPSHEPGKGPRILISSRLANEPNPSLKEPGSGENVKAGGPFWEPFSLYEENTTLKNVLLGVLIGLAVMALLVPLGLWLRKKWRRAPPLAPPRPAHVLAFERLEALRQRGIPAETAEAQAFAFELSEILREYFGNRYHFYSLEMTITELLAELKQINPAGLTASELEDFFEFLDMVKFAKMPLDAPDAASRLETGVDFVRKTLVVLLEPAPASSPGEPGGEMSLAAGARPEVDPVDHQPKPESVEAEPVDPYAPPAGESMDSMHRRLLLEKTRDPGPESPQGGDHEAS